MKKITKLENGNVRVRTYNDEPSRTQQQFKDQCDINQIMKKYHSTGQITHLRTTPGRYLDTTNVPSYQEALNTIINANDSFNALPSEVRKRLGNDPKNMIDFLSDPNNDDEARKLGLKLPLPTPQPDPLSQIQNDLNEIKSHTKSKKSQIPTE